MSVSINWSIIAIYAGGIVILLNLVDVLLRPHQREWLRGRTKQLSDWLNTWSFRAFLAKLGGKNFSYWACIIAHGLLVILMVWALVDAVREDGLAILADWQLIIMFVVVGTFALAGWFLRPVWHHALRFYASEGHLLWFGLKTIVTFVLLWALMYSAFLGLERYGSAFFGELGFEYGGFATYAVGVVTALIILIFYFFFILFFFTYALWLFMLVLGGLVALLRFLLIRMVEHKKGPVFALSAIVAAIGAAYEYWSG
ncbi:MAG: hypothetical protein AAFR71_01105 [Pseudomonadota bacterium]